MGRLGVIPGPEAAQTTAVEETVVEVEEEVVVVREDVVGENLGNLLLKSLLAEDKQVSF